MKFNLISIIMITLLVLSILFTVVLNIEAKTPEEIQEYQRQQAKKLDQEYQEKKSKTFIFGLIHLIVVTALL